MSPGLWDDLKRERQTALAIEPRRQIEIDIRQSNLSRLTLWRDESHGVAFEPVLWGGNDCFVFER